MSFRTTYCPFCDRDFAGSDDFTMHLDGRPLDDCPSTYALIEAGWSNA